MALTKKWIFPGENEITASNISKICSVGKLVGKILASRGFDEESALKFLDTSANIFYNPFLLSGMKEAVSTVSSAILNNEKIAVYGDYDTDGITSTYIVYDYLKSSNADIIYYIPDRESEGYGVSKTGIDKLKQKGVRLIITVDTGITATTETEYAKELGINMVITDHHTLKDTLPNATAVINPKIKSNYPFDALAGVGVAFKLVYALSGCNEKIFNKYCPFAAIGTIADMVPLTDENRYIAAKGLKKIRETNNLGLIALAQFSGKDINALTSSDIGFAFAPRLNAAGRMADASLSVELLLAKSKTEAEKYASAIEECNRNRQKEEQEILSEALDIIRENHFENDSYILVAKENWLHGVIGIVSSRITEMFCKPSSVISINSDGTGKASGRSIRGINLFNALQSCKENLVKFGGHELAAGFTVKSGMVDALRQDMNRFMQPFMSEEICTPTLEIDAKISLDDICTDTAKELEILEPHGIGNRAPVFCLENVKVAGIRYTANGKHAFITVSSNDSYREIPAFSMANRVKSIESGDIISIAGSLGINTYKGRCTAQFIARDIHAESQPKHINRTELAMFFAAMREEMANSYVSMDKFSLMPLFGKDKMSAFKLSTRKTALKIFEELEIIEIKDCGSTITVRQGKNFKSKTNLANSKTYLKFNTVEEVTT